MINVLGDALAAGIMAHICRKDFAQDTGTEVRTVSLREAAETVVPSLWVVTLSRGRGAGAEQHIRHLRYSRHDS